MSTQTGSSAPTLAGGTGQAKWQAYNLYRAIASLHNARKTDTNLTQHLKAQTGRSRALTSIGLHCPIHFVKIKEVAVEHLMVRCWEESLSDDYGADSWNADILQASMAALRPLLLLPHVLLAGRKSCFRNSDSSFSTHHHISHQVSQSQTSLDCIGRG